jgi:hypothetical protein
MKQETTKHREEREKGLKKYKLNPLKIENGYADGGTFEVKEQYNWENEFDNLFQTTINGRTTHSDSDMQPFETKTLIKAFIIKDLEQQKQSLIDRLSEIQSSCHSWQEYHRKVDNLMQSLKEE